MKPPLLAGLSFIAGAIIAGGSTYALKTKHDAVREQNQALVKDKMPYGSYTMMLDARLKARQAMLFFRFRENENLSAGLCSRDLGNYLATIDEYLVYKGMYSGYGIDLEADRKEILRFFDAYPMLSKPEKQANQTPEPTPTAVTPDADASVAPSAGAAHL